MIERQKTEMATLEAAIIPIAAIVRTVETARIAMVRIFLFLSGHCIAIISSGRKRR